MLPIKGIQKTTLVDYPGKIAATIFLGGCNFRCPFCHNVTLVKDHENTPNINETEMIEYLAGRKKQLEGICITGGEPTLFKELPDFISKIKELGYSVKLDTNGTIPEMIQSLLDNKLIDYIAMDIKAPISCYDQASGVKVDLAKIKQSIELIKNGNIEYEFRTTVVPQFYPKERAGEVVELIGGADKYFLQQFENSVEVLDPQYQDIKAYSKDQLDSIVESLSGSFGLIKTKGVL